MKIEEYIRHHGEKKEKGPTSWLSFCTVNLQSGQLSVADPTLFPDGVTVDLTPGPYAMEIQLIHDEVDFRVAKLRVTCEPNPVLSDVIDEVSVDFGRLGIGDAKEIENTGSKLSFEEAQERLSVLDAETFYGKIIWDNVRNIEMPFVSSGYGDGCYKVRELKHKGKRVGVLVDFLEDVEE